MRQSSKILGRVAAAAVFTGGLLLLGAAPAAADTTIPINPGNVPTTAAGAGTHECTQTGSSADRDGWVFVLPGNKGKFTSLTLHFSSPGGPVTLVIPTDGGTIDAKGTKAWITTPAGWTLVGASATISGSSNGFFVLTHTCPAAGTPTPAPTPRPSESPSSSPTSGSGTPSGTAALVGTPAGAAAGLLLVGGSLLGSGMALIRARRRRDTEA